MMNSEIERLRDGNRDEYPNHLVPLLPPCTHHTDTAIRAQDIYYLLLSKLVIT